MKHTTYHVPQQELTGYSTHVEMNAVSTPLHLLCHKTVPIVTAHGLIDKTFFMNHVPMCSCDVCDKRKQKNLRPLSFFSPTHTTRQQGMRILVMDTEASGAKAEQHPNVTDTEKWPYMTEWAWLVYDVDSRQIVKTESSHIHFPNRSPSTSPTHTPSNSLAPSHLEEFEYVMKSFIQDYKQCHFVVGHNIDHDKKMIQVECFRRGLSVNHVWAKNKQCKPFCTKLASIDLCGLKWTPNTTHSPHQPHQPIVSFKKYPKLSELHHVLFGEFNKEIPLNHLHEALYDTLVCFRCFHVLAFQEDPFRYASVIHNPHQSPFSKYSLFSKWNRLYGTKYMTDIQQALDMTIE